METGEVQFVISINTDLLILKSFQVSIEDTCKIRLSDGLLTPSGRETNHMHVSSLCQGCSCWPVNIVSLCWRNVPLVPWPVCVYIPPHQPLKLISLLLFLLLLFLTRGFSVNTAGRSHVFKPVSVQAMWWVNHIYLVLLIKLWTNIAIDS